MQAPRPFVSNLTRCKRIRKAPRDNSDYSVFFPSTIPLYPLRVWWWRDTALVSQIQTLKNKTQIEIRALTRLSVDPQAGYKILWHSRLLKNWASFADHAVRKISRPDALSTHQLLVPLLLSLIPLKLLQRQHCTSFPRSAFHPVPTTLKSKRTKRARRVLRVQRTRIKKPDPSERFGVQWRKAERGRIPVRWSSEVTYRTVQQAENQDHPSYPSSEPTLFSFTLTRSFRIVHERVRLALERSGYPLRKLRSRRCSTNSHPVSLHRLGRFSSPPVLHSTILRSVHCRSKELVKLPSAKSFLSFPRQYCSNLFVFKISQ